MAYTNFILARPSGRPIWGSPSDGWRPECDEMRDAYNFFRWKDGVETGQCVAIGGETLALDDDEPGLCMSLVADELRKAGGPVPPRDQWSPDPAAEQLLWLDGMGGEIDAAARAMSPVFGMLPVVPGLTGRDVLLSNGGTRPRSKVLERLDWDQESPRECVVDEVLRAAKRAGKAVAAHVAAAAKEMGAPVERLALWHAGPYLVDRLRHRYAVTWRRVNDEDGPRFEMRVGSYFGVTDVRTDEEMALARERWEAGKTCECRLRHAGDCSPARREALDVIQRHR